MKTVLQLIESGVVPDFLVRAGIRQLNRRRLRDEGRGGVEALSEHQRAFIASLRQSPIAVLTQAANQQHYEVPPAFFQHALGRRLKYSCCYYPTGTESLDSAEEAMLALTCQRARLADGMDVLELGCGWGSLTLWMAENYPHARITAVSDSAPQREFILAQCRQRGHARVEVITADMNHFETDRRFDRIVSVEMFEHMRNYERLLERVASWLRPGGTLFVHVFCHREFAYSFETEGQDNWMGRYFFSGGIMPSDGLLLHFQDHLVLADRWRVSGTHYQNTANHWLANVDARREQILPILEQTYGKSEAPVWLQRWRMFFMACAELWGHRQGREWWVAHYLFRSRTTL